MRAVIDASIIIRFPPRRATAIWVLRDGDGAWLALAGDHGWAHGCRREAVKDARWLAQNLNLPILEILQ